MCVLLNDTTLYNAVRGVYCQSFLCAAERRRNVVKEEKVFRKRSITAKQRQEAFETLVQAKIQKMIRVATISKIFSTLLTHSYWY